MSKAALVNPRIILAIAALILAGVTACTSGSKPPLAIFDAGSSGTGLRDDVLQPPIAAPRTSLEDTAGRRYDLRQTPDKVSLVYFGYTRCPDICPTIMADVAQALRESTAAVRAKVEVIFVSVDPQRDSRRVIRRWLDNFNQGFIGLRGPIREVIRAQHAMAVPVSRVRPHSKHGYTVEHSAELIAFTPDHRAHVLYTDGPAMVSDLRHDLEILTTSTTYGA